MATKYVDTTLTTGANDGSTKADAWRTLRTPLNSASLVVAGDVLVVRTADGAGADILDDWGSNTLSAWMSGATETAPITVIFDDGTEWAYGGTLTVRTSNSVGHEFRVYNYQNWLGRNRVVFDQTAVSTAAVHYQVWVPAGLGIHSFVQGLRFVTNRTGVSGTMMIAAINGYTETVFDQCEFVVTLSNSSAHSSFTHNHSCITGNVVARGCKFTWDLVTNSTPDFKGRFFKMDDTLSRYAPVCVNSKFEALGSTLWVLIHDTRSYYYPGIRTIDCSFVGGSADLTPDLPSLGMIAHTQHASSQHLAVSDATDYYRAWCGNQLGQANWARTIGGSNQNYPTATALLPDATPWSWRFKVTSFTKRAAPFLLPPITKRVTQATGVYTVVARLLAVEAVAGTLKRDHAWMSVTYTDSSGERRSVHTRNPLLDLQAGTDGDWTAVTYAAKNYDSYEIRLTLPAAVATGADLLVCIYLGIPSTVTEDYYFVDPDVSLVAV